MGKQKKEGSPSWRSLLAAGIVFGADTLLLAGGISLFALGAPVALGISTIAVSGLLITKNLFDIKPTNKFLKNMYTLANWGLYATTAVLMFAMGGPIALGATLAIVAAAHLARPVIKDMNFSTHDLHDTEEFLPSDDILAKQKKENKEINLDLDNTDLHTYEKNNAKENVIKDKPDYDDKTNEFQYKKDSMNNQVKSNEIELNKVNQEDKLKPILFNNIKNSKGKNNDRDKTKA